MKSVWVLAFGIGLALLAPRTMAQDYSAAISKYLANSAPVPLALSPDGTYLAATVPDPDDDRRRLLAVLRLSDNKSTFVSGLGKERSVTRVRWVNRERMLVETSTFSVAQETPSSTGELYAVNFDGSQGRWIFRGGASYDWLGRLPGDAKRVLIATYKWGASTEGMPIPEVVKLDVYTGAQTVVGRGPAGGASLVADAQGNVRFAYVAMRDRSVAVYAKNGEGEWEKRSVTAPGSGGINPLFVHEDGKRLYALANDDADTLGLVLLEPETGARELLYRHAEADVSSLSTKLCNCRRSLKRAQGNTLLPKQDLEGLQGRFPVVNLLPSA